jgi:hypothetical protein
MCTQAFAAVEQNGGEDWDEVLRLHLFPVFI